MHRIWTVAQKSLVLAITGGIGIKKSDPRLSGKFRKFSTTLLFTPRADSKVSKVEKH
jgi:hypothetical protein